MPVFDHQSRFYKWRSKYLLMLLQSRGPKHWAKEVLVMSWCLRFAGVLAVGGLLTIGEVLAQQPAIAEAGLTKSIRRVSEAHIAPRREPPQALSLRNVNRLTPLDEAYLDAFSILKENNTCSGFYGGPAAIEVLNQLKQQLKTTLLDSTVAVRMIGRTTNHMSLHDALSYRLFQKAELNFDGPFYRRSLYYSDRSIGGFPPNTREARVMILLHELGHLIGRDRKWLLPNDGASEDLVRENTKRVIAVCGKQIRRLSRISFARQLQAARSTSRGPATETHVLGP